MAFPTVSTLIDDFNRASPGANWSTLFGSGIRINVAQTFATGQAAADNGDASYYNAATYGPSGHFYATSEVGLAGTWQGIHFVTTPGSGTTDGYSLFVSYDGTNRIRAYRMDNDSLTQLGSQVSYTPADTDLVGFERDSGNGTIEAWVNTGSGWTDMGGNWNDTTYATGTAWYVGLECSYDFDNSGNAWDDLRGGTSTPSGGGITRQSSYYHMMGMR